MRPPVQDCVKDLSNLVNLLTNIFSDPYCVILLTHMRDAPQFVGSLINAIAEGWHSTKVSHIAATNAILSAIPISKVQIISVI